MAGVIDRPRRLAVMAHFDPAGRLAPHALRQVEALRQAFDEVVLVSTSTLVDGARAALPADVRLIERPNVGYDFLSYRVGLESTDLAGHDEVLICNDSFVGPLRSYERVLADMARRDVDFWGMTASRQIRPHVQSYFVLFRRAAHRSAAFDEFWSGMEPLSDRTQVIRRYELGLTERLEAAGLRAGAYFEPDPDDDRLARRRMTWWAAHQLPAPWTRGRREELRRRGRNPGNPCATLADAALADGRLPMVKLDTLRYDPLVLGSDRLLRLCERRFPEEFAGVRRYLAQTDGIYERRPESSVRTPAWVRPLRPLVRYGAASR